jgi:hypothetical protein
LGIIPIEFAHIVNIHFPGILTPTSTLTNLLSQAFAGAGTGNWLLDFVKCDTSGVEVEH